MAIYIMCPANVATGGPELLHQLAFELKGHNFEVYMYYINCIGSDPIHEAYRDYKLDFVLSLNDSEENLIIIPEIYTEFLKSYKLSRTIIWWLSVDNYFKYRPHVFGLINRFLLNKFNYQSRLFFGELVRQADFHLVQSDYAAIFLKSKEIHDYKYLSDYLSQEFLELSTDQDRKENIVAYNPKKGLKFTEGLIRFADNIEFVPIQNMSRTEVIKLLQRAKVYIDFGNHPGKDRIPREAAICHCCVITGKRGSANSSNDLPIPDKYKFKDDLSHYKEILECISDCFENYDERNAEFNEYRKIIRGQRSEFEHLVEKYLCEVFGSTDSPV